VNSYDQWDDERDRLLNGVGADDRETISDLVDRAANAARASNLNEAAAWLEKTRHLLVERNLFRSWDDGILVFSSMIRLIRGMSAETDVPRAYQHLMAAIPSLHYDVEMSRSQKVFWYGAASRPGEPEAPELGEVLLSAIALIIIFGALYLYMR
jgi:hypothetical protein